MFHVFAVNLKRTMYFSVNVKGYLVFGTSRGLLFAELEPILFSAATFDKKCFLSIINRIVLFYCESLNLGLQKKNQNITLRLIVRSCKLISNFYSAVYERQVLEEHSELK